MARLKSPGQRPRRLLAAALAAVLGLGTAPGVPVALIRTAALALTVATVTPDQAEARRSSGSGGYSRPSSGGSGSTRSPSYGSSGSGSSSSSGGYSRPRSGSSGSGSSYDSSSSAGSDRDASRSRSRSAYDDYTAPPPRTPSSRDRGTDSGGYASSGSDWDGGSSSSRRRPRSDDYDPYGYYGGRGYSPPGYATGGRSSFGVFDGIMLWFLLDTLTDRSHSQFFRDNQNDPGYREWRAEADKLAAGDPALKAKLAQLDRELASGAGDPSRAGQLPGDVPDTVGRARDLAGGPGFGVILVVLLIGGVILFMMWRLSRGGGNKQGAGAAPPRTVGGDGTALGSAAAILRNKISGATYQPDLFRVGMPLTLDPSAFILAEGATKITAPKTMVDNGKVGVDAVGTVTDGGGTYHRLYLEDEGAFFQLVLTPQGNPSECRYFKRIDEVQPADRDEWAFWLDSQDGMVGWPEFEAKDGQLYDRVWSPGKTRVPPRDMAESVETLDGTTARKLRMMLYARKTGLSAPSPETEYLLVTVVDARGQAYVELHAGIDFNPSALSLS